MDRVLGDASADAFFHASGHLDGGFGLELNWVGFRIVGLVGESPQKQIFAFEFALWPLPVRTFNFRQTLLVLGLQFENREIGLRIAAMFPRCCEFLAVDGDLDVLQGVHTLVAGDNMPAGENEVASEHDAGSVDWSPGAPVRTFDLDQIIRRQWRFQQIHRKPI